MGDLQLLQLFTLGVKLPFIFCSAEPLLSLSLMVQIVNKGKFPELFTVQSRDIYNRESRFPCIIIAQSGDSAYWLQRRVMLISGSTLDQLQMTLPAIKGTVSKNYYTFTIYYYLPGKFKISKIQGYLGFNISLGRPIG